ncbi:hypothetical protein J6590_061305 [Homalodisca vitripennis]|nr:hypothetical protein J6590_061305 [Homalodisca vitripennis]
MTGDIKYRQQRILKNCELSWRCLGRNCGATIKADADITRVTVCNDKHSGDHPATMRTLLSPLPKSRPASPAVPPAASLVTPEPASASPSSGCLPASDPSPICSTPIAPSRQTSSDQPETEVYRLKAEYTDQIFLGNSSRVDQTARAPATVDCGVQYEMHGGSAPTTMDISVQGDSHTRHIAGLMRPLIGPVTQVDDICMPVAGLLDVVGPKISTRPGKQCEVLIVGTNDMARGKQHVIYSSMEAYIATRPKNSELVLATLPHRHDLDHDDPIHDETVLVNAYIEELATRYNTKLVYFDSIGRRNFTRHGQHVSMKGKRLLAKMIVESLASMGPATPSASKAKTAPSKPRQRVPAPVTSSITTPPPTAVPGSPLTVQQQQTLTYAEAVTGSVT